MSPADTFALIDACSPFLRGLREAHPDFTEAVMSGDSDAHLATLISELRTADLSKDGMMKRLRLAKQKLALMVGLYDVSGIWPLDKVTGALTRFADAAVQAALEFQWKQEQEKGTLKPDAPVGQAYVVLAMGKMGAFELNYSSDIDLIVFYDEMNAPLVGDTEPSTFFVKLTRGIVSLLQDPTEDGYVFRTDLRLRPDPRATQVAIDIEAAANYYETQGQNWERAAMIKARACAGDAALGAEFLSRMKPYIWRKYLDYAAIADVQSMKRQIHAVKGHGEIAVLGHNLKLGRGGIREIEFFAQTQQLIAGGRNPALRCVRTRDTLDALAEAKWITPQAATELKDAYVFLRMLEHRAQMVNDQQTHDTPSDPVKFESYARFAGFANGEALAAKLRATLECVQGHYARLFESAEELASDEGSLVFTGSDDDPATLETLRRMGYAQVTEVAATIRAWHFGRYRSTRTARARELLTEIMPQLLKTLSEGGDADRAFFAFDKFLATLPSGVQLLSMLKANPRILNLISQVLGSAPRLAEKISAQPRILEAVTAPDFFSGLPTKASLTRDIDALIPQGAALEEAMDLARIFAREKNFRVGVRILSETISAEEAGRAFSSIADVVLTRLFGAVLEDIGAKHGQIKGGACVIVGLGKLGGHEMTAGSDLDLMLIYDCAEDADMSDGKRPLAPAQYYGKITQALMSALNAPTAEGKLYDVDMRLRPSGSSGPVAVSADAFEAYHRDEAWTWERMAMTRARAITGDEALAARVRFIITATLSATRDHMQMRRDIAEMRALMLKEQKPDGVWDLKRQRGGQVEIEFIAQWLELSDPLMLNPNTAAVIEATGRAELLNAHDTSLLLNALGLYQRLTHVLRLCIDGHFDPKAAPAPLLKALNQAAALPDISTTEAYIAEMQEQVAGLFTELIGRPEPEAK